MFYWRLIIDAVCLGFSCFLLLVLSQLYLQGQCFIIYIGLALSSCFFVSLVIILVEQLVRALFVIFSLIITVLKISSFSIIIIMLVLGVFYWGPLVTNFIVCKLLRNIGFLIKLIFSWRLYGYLYQEEEGLSWHEAKVIGLPYFLLNFFLSL